MGWTVCVRNQDPSCPKIRKELCIFLLEQTLILFLMEKIIMSIWLEHLIKYLNKNAE